MKSESVWWAQRWLDPILDSKELRQKVRKGRIVARRGRVGDLEVRPGLITATVEEDSGVVREVRVRQPMIHEEVWDGVVERLAGEAAHAATLLSGRISREMLHFFEEAGAELFPFDHHDLTFFCTCGDDSPVCVHAVAAHFAAAEAMEGDPLLLLEFRGRNRDTLLGHLRDTGPSVLEPEQGSQGSIPDDTEPLDALMEGYWDAGMVPHLAFRLSAGDLEEDEALPVVRALGPGPAETPGEVIADVLAPIVRMGRRRIDQIVEQVADDDVPEAPDPTSADSLDDLLVAAAWQHGSLTSGFVADALGVSSVEARRYLHWLCEEGRLRKVGRARGTRYIPVGANDVPDEAASA
ncbi:MAG: FaeA/PapI family transcriptional regulator [Myxococcota bacterium]